MARKLVSRLPAGLVGVVLAATLVLVAHNAQAMCYTMDSALTGAMKKMNWDDAFPITIMGFPLGKNSDPPLMYESPICFCPSDLFGEPLPGIGISYWNPLYIADTSTKPGCMQALATEMFDGQYDGQTSGNGRSANNRRQVHWYVSPIFKLLDMFMNMACHSNSSYFDLAYMTEVDPIWQDDIWSALFAPESSVFANVLSRLVCMADAVSVDIAYPLDALYWCLGADHMFPLSGNDVTAAANEDANMKALGRFLFRHHRVGALFMTIGPGAQCSSHYSPVLPKSQYRIDPVYPESINGSPIYPGKKYLFWRGLPPPLASYPTHESGTFVLWRGTQCCLVF